MNKSMFDVPVLLLIFNRPDTTFKVFEQIRRCGPSRLFIAADGPRKDVAEDKENCEKARRIIEQVDWDCEVKTLFRESNLGCGVAPSSAISWFFKNVEEGIILEDDCVPHLTFFRFCKELLEYYRNDRRIMTISGSNLQSSRKRTEYSYYFSRYTFMWGWASWRRAWSYYDFDMKLWPEARDKGLLYDILGNKREASFWKNTFEKIYKGEESIWDYRWLFACWLQSGLTVVPAINLVSNIGFEGTGTHNRGRSVFANLESREAVFPLSNPSYVLRDVAADKLSEKLHFSSSRFYRKIIDIIYGH